MLVADERDLLAAAMRLHDDIAGCAPPGTAVRVVRAQARPGGGSLPLVELEGPALAVTSPAGPDALAARLRRGDPAIVARVQDGAVLLDPRTIADVELEFVVRGVCAALHALA